MEDEEYIRLLDAAMAKLPHLNEANADFVIPPVDSLVQGSKTIVRNILAIADKARRNPADIAKYLSRELATPVGFEEQRLVINGKFDANELNKQIIKYFDRYVICRECHKPDTHLESAPRGMMYLVCEACGARYAVKNY